MSGQTYRLKTQTPRDSASTEVDLQVLLSRSDREQIFEQLHARHYPSINSVFARRGFTPAECQELTQETFLRAYRGIHGFREQSQFGTWLFQIATNVAANEIRSRSADKRDRPEVSLDVVGAPTSDGDSVVLRSREREPVDQLLSKEKVALVRQGLEELPPRMRRCLQLRLDQELKFREIAVLEQVSIDTVKSQLAQAKKRLRTALGGYFDEVECEESSGVSL